MTWVFGAPLFFRLSHLDAWNSTSFIHFHHRIGFCCISSPQSVYVTHHMCWFRGLLLQTMLLGVRAKACTVVLKLSQKVKLPWAPVKTQMWGPAPGVSSLPGLGEERVGVWSFAFQTSICISASQVMPMLLIWEPRSTSRSKIASRCSKTILFDLSGKGQANFKWAIVSVRLPAPCPTPCQLQPAQRRLCLAGGKMGGPSYSSLPFNMAFNIV